MQCKCWVSQHWRVAGAERVKLLYTCQHFPVDCWWWWLLVLKLLFHQTFKVQHHLHTTSDHKPEPISIRSLASHLTCFACRKLNFFSLFKISHKSTVNFPASPSCHTSSQLWLRYTKIMIHQFSFCSLIRSYARLFIVTAASFLSVKLNWVCMAFRWKLQIWCLEQVSMTEKSVTHSFPCVAVSSWFLSSQHAYLNGISFYHVAFKVIQLPYDNSVLEKY